jgi:hypothetical protein
MKQSTKDALWLGGTVLGAGALAGTIIYVASKPAPASAPASASGDTAGAKNPNASALAPTSTPSTNPPAANLVAPGPPPSQVPTSIPSPQGPSFPTAGFFPADAPALSEPSVALVGGRRYNVTYSATNPNNPFETSFLDSYLSWRGPDGGIVKGVSGSSRSFSYQFIASRSINLPLSAFLTPIAGHTNALGIQGSPSVVPL